MVLFKEQNGYFLQPRNSMNVIEYSFCSNKGCDKILQNSTCESGHQQEFECLLAVCDAKAQLGEILNRLWDKVFDFTSEIFDKSSIMKNFKVASNRSCANLIPITLNTDGVQLFKGSVSAIWPVYLSIPSLPLDIR